MLRCDVRRLDGRYKQGVVWRKGISALIPLSAMHTGGWWLCYDEFAECESM
jgi:hypothetical protein